MAANKKTDPLLSTFVLTEDEWKKTRQAFTQVTTSTKVILISLSPRIKVMYASYLFQVKALFPAIASTAEQFTKYIKTFSPMKDFEAKQV